MTRTTKTPLRLSPSQTEMVAKMFQALAEPFRVQLLMELLEGPHTVSELTATLEARQSNVSKHLAILHTSGLATRTRDGTRVVYAVADRTAKDLCRIVCGKLVRDADRRNKLLSKATPRPKQ